MRARSSAPPPAPAGELPLESAELPADAVEVARVVGPWGVRGALRIKPHAAQPEALFSSKRWYLKLAPPGPSGTDAATLLLAVRLARQHGEHVIAEAAGIDDRDLAQCLAGARVHVPRASFPTPPPDEYYWVDLIGLNVVNREQVVLGQVSSLFETGPHCVLRVLDATGTPPHERLIPFVSAYVDAVDLEARQLRVDWAPED